MTLIQQLDASFLEGVEDLYGSIAFSRAIMNGDTPAEAEEAARNHEFPE